MVILITIPIPMPMPIIRTILLKYRTCEIQYIQNPYQFKQITKTYFMIKFIPSQYIIKIHSTSLPAPKIQKMNTLRKFFCQFDMFTAPATLRIQSEPEMRSFPIGLISFAFACLFIYLFINNTINVVNFTKIDTTQSESIIKSSDVKGEFPMFALTLDFMDNDEFSRMFALQIYVIKEGNITKQIGMKKCTPEQWQLLGDTSTKDYQQYYLSYMLCPENYSNFQIKQTFRSNTPDFILVTLTACTPSSPNDTTCVPADAEQYLKNRSRDGSALIWLYVLDKAIVPDQKVPVTYFINIDTKVSLTKKSTGGAIIEFSTYKIQTDVSIYPFQQIQTQTGVMIDTVRTYQGDLQNITTDALARIQFTMNQRLRTIKRKVGKLDQLLSYSGGLFSIVISFLSFFLLSYNEYKYQLKIAENTFNYRQDGKNVIDNNLNLWTYLQYTIYEWISVLCCCELQWKYCRQLEETRNEVKCQMEVGRLFRRIQGLEIMSDVTSHFGDNERMCVKLVQTPSFAQSKNNRLMMDYYETLTNGKTTITLQQASLITNIFSMALGKSPASAQAPDNRVHNEYDFYMSGNNDGESNSVEEIQLSGIMLHKSNLNGNIGNNESKMEGKRDGTVDEILELFPECREQAEKVMLSEELEEVEKRYIQAYANMKPQVRKIIQKKIPLIILHRLRRKQQKKQQL